MNNAHVAICETLNLPAATGDRPHDCTGVLLNRVHRSMRVPGRGLNFEVLYRDSRCEGPDHEFRLEFQIAERDFRTILERGTVGLIGACKRWLEEHAADGRSAAPHVLSPDHFDCAPLRKLAA